MAYLLDTNIIIFTLNEMPSVLQKLAANEDAVLTSAINVVERQREVQKEPAYAGVRRARLALLLRHIQVLPFDAAAAEAMGRSSRCAAG